MNPYELFFLCSATGTIGFVLGYVFFRLRINQITEERDGYCDALDVAVETIATQHDELHSLLKEAARRGSELVN